MYIFKGKSLLLAGPENKSNTVCTIVAGEAISFRMASLPASMVAVTLLCVSASMACESSP